jgi:hypothetical protein
LSARRFVSSAIAVIILIPVAISVEDSPSLLTCAVVTSATPTAWLATHATSAALCEMSRIERSISCAPCATVCTFSATPIAASETPHACSAASIALEVALNSSAAAATAGAEADTDDTTSRMPVCASSRA